MTAEQDPRTTSRLARVHIQGDLGETALADVIGFLVQTRKSGHLMIERQQPRRSAAIHLRAGEVVHAICPPRIGVEAVYEMLGWRSGRYVLAPGGPSEDRTIAVDVQSLLLEGMRRLDELERWLAVLPERTRPLHRVYDAHATAGARIGLAGWRLYRRIDGERSVDDLLGAAPGRPIDTARDLHELIVAGLVGERPDYGFLAGIRLRRTSLAASLRLEPAAAALADACDGSADLAAAAERAGVAIPIAAEAARRLIESGAVLVAAGQDLVRRHLG